jgi:tRNA pseudouridine55 synthase
MNGLLILDKPQGITSHDCVYKARRATKIKQIGHAGTLDPMATGVLVLCIGKATRLSEYLLGEDKAYQGLIKLGQRTNTDDADGEVIETRPVPEISDEVLARVQQAFTGEILQVPPQFSAIKRDGQRAYALARKGENVELEARRMTIHDFRLTIFDRDTLKIDVKCSAGTYIRSLARDVGEMLGCGGHLTMLRRTQAGAFSIREAMPLDSVGLWAAHLLPMDRAVSHFPKVVLTEAQAKDFGMGRFLDAKLLDAMHFESASHLAAQAGVCRVYDAHQNLIGIGNVEHSTLKPAKVFAGNSTD